DGRRQEERLWSRQNRKSQRFQKGRKKRRTKIAFFALALPLINAIMTNRSVDKIWPVPSSTRIKGASTMRKELSILAACSALAVGGIGILAARADDPNQPANQTTNQPADRTTDRMDRGDYAKQQSPAAREVRDTIAEATSAAIQGKFGDEAPLIRVLDGTGQI